MVRVLIQFGQITLLTRLLVPEDFGLMAVALAVIAFGGIFAEAGLGSALIHRPPADEATRSSVFWLSAIIGFAASTAMAASAPLIALVYSNSQVAGVVLMCSPLLLLGSVSRQFEVTAERALRFRGVVIIETVCALAGLFTAVIGAFLGLGVSALAAAALASALLRVALTWRVLGHGWLPSFHLRLGETSTYLSFGGALMISNIANQLNQSVDIFLGARLLGLDALGRYSVPRQLVFALQSAINPVITRVSFPVIAQVENDRDRVRSVYRQTLNMVASTGAPLYLGASWFAEEICTILFGAAWHESAGILRVLALWGAVRVLGNPVGALLLGVGRADKAMWWNLTLLLVCPGAIWIGSGYGAIGLAWSVLALAVGLTLPSWYWLVYPHTGWRLADYLVVSLRPMVLAALAIAPGWWASSVADDAILKLVCGVAVAAPLYLTFSWWCNRAWVSALRELLVV